MKSLNLQAKKTLLTMLATATGAVSLLATSVGISTPANAGTAGRTLFSCSARNVYVEVSQLRNGTLRYTAFNIPSTLQRPSLLLNGGTVKYNQYGETVYRFRNSNYLYAAVKDSGYGKVLVYKNNRLIGTNYCGDV